MSADGGTAPRPTLIEWSVLAVTFLCLAVFVVFPIRSFDLFWHIANGKAMFEQGRIVQEDLFSYTEYGKGFANHWWLAQILLYMVYKGFGANGLIVFKTVLALGIAGLFYRAARALGGDRFVICLLLLVAFIAGWWRYMVRPQLFSYLLLGLTAYILFATREGKLRNAYLFALVPVFVVWDFLHGALYGLVLLGTFTAGETLKVIYGRLVRKDPNAAGAFFKTLLFAALLVVVAMFLNPFGIRSYGIFKTLFEGGASAFVLTGEFYPPKLNEYHMFWGLLAIATATTIISSFKRIDITNIFVIGAFAAMALKYNRAIGVFALMSVPVLAAQHQVLLSFSKRDMMQKLFRGAAVALIVLCGAYMVQYKFFTPGNHYRFGFGLNDEKLPVAAARFVEGADLKGNMFNFDYFGGYFSYFLYPERKIYSYNLPEVFNRELLESNSVEFLSSHDITYAVVGYDAFWTKLALRNDPKWVLVFWDSAATVFVRDDGRNRHVVEQYRLRYLLPGTDMRGLQAMAVELPPAGLRRLAQEMANELMFARDEVMADFLGGMLLGRRDVFSPEDQVLLARKAVILNPGSSRLQQVIGHSR